MSYTERIGELFAGLKQTGSLKAALSDGVRLACEATGCSAGAVFTDLDGTRAADSWFRHDPHGMFERLASADATHEAGTAVGHDQSRATSCVTGMGRQVRVPLRCGTRDVGWLTFLTPPEVDEEQFEHQITGIDAALAVLMVAVESSATTPLSGVLSRQAFWDRVASEISRSQRGDDEFSVLHVRITGMKVSAGDELTSRWARIARLCEGLASRLRTSDVVGLMGADRLAVLFVTTGRLGARIAARRIEQILRRPEDDLSSQLDFSVVLPEFCLRTFPDDGYDADNLCRVQHWCSEVTALAVPGVRPR